MIIDSLTAITINGFISEKGKSSLELLKYFTDSDEVLDFQYRLRNEYDAIMVGTNTVIIDNPNLNSHQHVSSSPYCRITIDREGRIPRNHHFFDGAVQTYVGITSETPVEFVEFLKLKNISFFVSKSDSIDFIEFFKYLECRGIKKILVEGGGKLISSFIELGIINIIHLIKMPLFVNSNSTEFFVSAIDALKLELMDSKKIGEFIVTKYKV